MPHPDVTMAMEAIHNPAEPRHFMRVKPAAGHVRVLRGSDVLADSDRALHVTEVGRDVHATVLYIPRDDVSAALQPVPGKSTHCPLKGDAGYLALAGETPIAWVYDATLPFADAIKGHVAFYRDRVVIEERGENA